MQRLWDRIKKTPSAEECWEWTGSFSSGGRPQFWFQGFNDIAYRVVYLLEVGPIPDGKVISHICNNPKCCNPNHLKAVFPFENSAYMVACNREASNEKNGNVKLTNKEVSEIRLKAKTAQYYGKKGKELLAKEFCINLRTVYRIVNNEIRVIKEVLS